jgi:hypothetical protein
VHTLPLYSDMRGGSSSGSKTQRANSNGFLGKRQIGLVRDWGD